ncbi:hypothetical protein GPECTOR_11g243 [Gonium pectorale]|uniref:SNF2 super family n=1 Tax=Gonium pectorale TaxID=33097 RepID=A0A150GPR8_GONPE|nr:hypothetical protein GPECTOR_11g243 [Gonium pectorale]|eukprot:KXZ51801.1 hypothetical protein GPECTOR_11g243 [Gonium pectorale]
MVDMTQVADDDDEEEDIMELVGSTRTKVVGVRYYNGEANRNEVHRGILGITGFSVSMLCCAMLGMMVLLIREPNNPYDKWAIRVDNIRGEKIGHISREQAAVLAPLIDRGKLRIEGLVAGAKGVYQMPIDLFCFCQPQDESDVVAKLQRGGIALGGGGARGSGGGGAGGAAGKAGSMSIRPMAKAELDNSLERMFDEVHNSAALQPAMDPDPEVLSRLFPHQRVALAWMIGRENGVMLPPFWEEQAARGGAGAARYFNSLANFTSPTRPEPLRWVVIANFTSPTRPEPLRGGILADDMGLGKTLTIISLLATNRPGAQLQPPVMVSLAEEIAQLAGAPEAGAAGAAAAAGTGPSGSGAAAAAVGKGGKRKGRKGKRSEEEDVEDVEDEDYAPKAKKRKTGAASSKGAAAAVGAGSTGPATTAALAAALSVRQEPPRADGPRATLIVCPVSVMSNWATQIAEHTAGNLKVYQYHGPDRSRNAAFLCGHDVVLTSYSVLGADLADGRGLLSVRWLRVVLDEAHTIKNPKAKWSQAAAKLKADRRWAVTGTPIQNRMADLYGLCAYLRLEPLQDKSIFTRAIERPLKAGDTTAVKRLQVLMGSIAMRRTKDLRIGGRPLVVLPRKSINLVTVHLTREDRAKYDALELQGRRMVAHALETSTLLENYMSVLEIILRLRQASGDEVADAGCLCTRDPLPLTEGLAAPGGSRGAAAAAPLSEEERAALLGLLTAGLQDDCPVCLEPLTGSAVITRCRHIFCRPCLENVLARAAGPGCPMCRAKVNLADLVELPPDAAAEPDTQAGQDVDDPEAASAKVAALLTTLKAAAAARPADGKGAVKAVVFSQFTGMLNLVGRALEAAGLAYVRLDGSTPAKARAEMLRTFASREPDSPLVFLASLKAGGVGMNLTAASQVHMLDPWWNPAVEEQAMDRVHRMGQTRDVEVFRYVAADTIEERMLLLQERKRELAAAAFDKRSAEENRQMRIDDVKLLMDL